jgi:O-antigen ligase
MPFSLSHQIVDRQSAFLRNATEALVVLVCGSLLALSIGEGWWTVVFVIPVLSAFAFLAVQARQEALVVAYVFISIILACLQVSIWVAGVPAAYAIVGLVRYALMGALVIWGLVIFYRNPSSLKTFDFAWLTLLSLVAVSVIYSVDRSRTISRGITLAALFLSLFALVRTLKRDPRGSVKIVNALILASACVFVPGFLLLLQEPELLLDASRFAGIFASPSAAGGVCCMVAPLAFWAAHYHPDPRVRIPCILLSLVLLAALLLSQTRNATAAFVVGMLATYILKKKKALNLLLPAATLLAMFGILLVMANMEWIQNTDIYVNYLNREGTFGTATGRLYLWEEGLRKIQERPLTGYGFGTGGVVIGMADLPKIVRYESEQLASYSNALPMLNLNRTEGLNAHNSYIEIWLELGIFGFLGCVWLLGCVTKEIVRIYRDTLPRSCGTLPPYLGGSLIAGLVNQSCEAALFSAGNIMCVVFWFVVAAILCLKTEPVSMHKPDAVNMTTLRHRPSPRHAFSHS